MQHLDYIIIGQGLAGTLLAHFLLEEGQKILIIDDAKPNSSSRVAAGLINPVTGRRYVKTWRIDELLPFAKETYLEIEKKLEISLYQEINILRTIFNRQEENNWLLRSGDPQYQQYILEEPDLGNFKEALKPVFGYSEVQNSCLASSELLIKSYRNFFEESGDLLTEEFDPAHLTIDPECINYKGNTAKKIIFCEGYRGMNNPYFSFLPFQPTKGDVLIVKIPNANFDKIFKQRIFVMPIGDDLYWAGATHERDFVHDQPTDEKREHLIKKLHDILTIPFEIVEHKAAIRPTVRDRRPFIGLHPDHTSVAIFNGLGTKGASLAPFWAKHVTDFLIHSVELDREVDIRRFLK